MFSELKLSDEEGRLRALNRYDVLDTVAEVPFDKIVALVQQVLMYRYARCRWSIGIANGSKPNAASIRAKPRATLRSARMPSKRPNR